MGPRALDARVHDGPVPDVDTVEVSDGEDRTREGAPERGAS
jgi:hypothetical protein